MDKQNQHKSICRQRKEREKQQRIQSILDAARTVFASKGYLKSTMDEIAMAAEITKPTIYLYFKSKDDLILSLILPLIAEIRVHLKKLEKNLNSGKIQDGRDLVLGIFHAYYNAYESSPETFRVLQLFQQKDLLGDFKPEIRSALDEKGRNNVILCRSMLTQGMEMGLLKKVDVYALADIIWGLVVGVVQLEDCKNDEENNHKLKIGTLGLAQQLITEALTRLE
ncbi:TetR/AcrR family transcriptional regulator [Desulfatibacillum aliphaticivorans]|uniref:TetR/AcrR family transcriptional regulator n=1 Tax=Desulfatibacillum aliphaticivorans TaxID=218208 RepID=UPI0003FB3219|nr:TetR/AcrR family transcriptional regulator [Desulfatibacillum aliphaticivorans]